MTPTIKDIARIANIDTGAVSRVLRDHPQALRLRPETRERIKKIAAELGYRRNVLASATRTGVVDTIALVMPATRFEIPALGGSLIGGIQYSAEKYDYGIRLFLVDNLEKSFDDILSHRIQNVLFLSLSDECCRYAADFCRAHGLRLVFVDTRGYGGFPGVMMDHFQSVHDLTAYLISLGHRNIGYICSPHRIFLNAERHRGYTEAMLGAGIEPRPEWQTCGEYPNADGIRKLLANRSRTRLTALAACGAIWLADAMRAAEEFGIDYPAELSMGCLADDTEASLTAIRLTHIHVSEPKTAENAVSLLLRGQCGVRPNKENTYLIKSELVILDSTFKNIKRKKERRT